MGRSTGLEPATLGTTNRCSNQLSYDRHDAPKGARWLLKGAGRDMQASGACDGCTAGAERGAGEMRATPTVFPRICVVFAPDHDVALIFLGKMLAQASAPRQKEPMNSPFMTPRPARAAKTITLGERLRAIGMTEAQAKLFEDMPSRLVTVEPRRPFREPGVAARRSDVRPLGDIQQI